MSSVRFRGASRHVAARHLEDRIEDLPDVLRGRLVGHDLLDPVHQAGHVDGGERVLGGELTRRGVHSVAARHVQGRAHLIGLGARDRQQIDLALREARPGIGERLRRDGLPERDRRHRRWCSACRGGKLLSSSLKSCIPLVRPARRSHFAPGRWPRRRTAGRSAARSPRARSRRETASPSRAGWGSRSVSDSGRARGTSSRTRRARSRTAGQGCFIWRDTALPPRPKSNFGHWSIASRRSRLVWLATWPSARGQIGLLPISARRAAAPARVVGFDLVRSASDRSAGSGRTPEEEAHACGEGERLSP